MFFSKLHLRLFTVISMLSLSACIPNTPQFNAPTQLTQSLNHSAMRVQQTNNELKITILVDQAFLPRGSHLTQATKQDLFKIAQSLHNNPTLKVKISAYTDNRGTQKSSQLVSLRRAMMVADFFRTHGIPSNRISTHGMGQADPIASNATSQGRTLNRRIEIILYPAS